MFKNLKIFNDTFAILNLIKHTGDCLRLELYKQTTSLYVPQSIKLLQRLFPDLSLILYILFLHAVSYQTDICVFNFSELPIYDYGKYLEKVSFSGNLIKIL